MSPKPLSTKRESERWKSIGFLRAGYDKSKRTRVVPRDDNGEKAGTQTEHWSGREDACVMPETIRVKIPRRRTDDG